MNLFLRAIYVCIFALTISTISCVCYRPQRSCGQGNIFTPVCHPVHRGVCLSACQDTTPPPSRHPPPGLAPPQEQTPPREQTHPPGADTPPPKTRHSPPGADTPHPREADSSIRSTSGRYASYWNAFLLWLIFHCQTRIQTWIRTRIPNPMNTLYYAELFPLHEFGSLSLIVTVPILGMDLCPCKPVYTQFIYLNKGNGVISYSESKTNGI